jgi:hypothetical protein
MIGGGAGHIADMIARINANEALRMSKRKGYDWAKKYYLVATGGRKIPYHEEPEHDLTAIREKIRKYKRSENIKNWIALGISIVIMVGIIYGLYWAYTSF